MRIGRRDSVEVASRCLHGGVGHGGVRHFEVHRISVEKGNAFNSRFKPLVRFREKNHSNFHKVIIIWVSSNSSVKRPFFSFNRTKIDKPTPPTP